MKILSKLNFYGTTTLNVDAALATVNLAYENIPISLS
jgi:hypothetical protein